MPYAMKLVRPLVAVAGVAMLPQAALAQNYSGTPATVGLGTTSYTENFNTLSSTSASSALPAGWRVSEENSTYSVGNGSSQTGDVYSFGATGATERALGALWSNGFASTIFGGFFTNNLGATINAFTINYNGEQYRNGTETNQLLFSYSTNATGLADTAGTWTNFAALNFTSPNSASISSTAISGTISGLSIANGGSFAIRWKGMDGTGTNDALAIDDVNIVSSLAAAAVPEPATWAMMIAGFAFVGAGLRRTRRHPAALA